MRRMVVLGILGETIMNIDRRFSLTELTIEKFIGYTYCYVIWKFKKVVAVVAAVAVFLFVISFCLKENPVFEEVRKLNKQAASSMFSNQPENAINTYNVVLTKLQPLSGKQAREMERATKNQLQVARLRAEQKLIKSCYPAIYESNVCAYNKKYKQAISICNTVIDTLKKSPFRGNFSDDYCVGIEQWRGRIEKKRRE